MTLETQPAQLLVVDDAGPGRDGLGETLRGLGYAVSVAESAVEVVDRFRGDPRESGPAIDLVLLNVKATRLNAYQVLKRVREPGAAPAVPVLILAPAVDPESIAKCLALGADDYLSVPFHPVMLNARIASCLERRRMRQRIERDSVEQREAEEVLRAREKYERDIQIGRQIQTSFLPSELLQPAGWEVAARFQPARQVAGDWYDAFALAQINRVGLVIGDVCDKGVGAALFMALMRSLIRAFAQQPSSLRWLDAIGTDAPSVPAGGVRERRRALPTVGTTALRNAVEQTNNYIAKNHAQTGMFATLFIALLDPRTGTLIYVNGGHEAPAIIGPGGVKARLDPTGLAVGMLPDSDYEIQSVRLEPGETLIAYTDGVPEARDPERKFFTEKRLLALLDQPAPTAAALLERIVDNVGAHIAEADQYDDVTLLALRRAASVA